MTADQLKPGKTLRGPIFPEPVEVIVAQPMGEAVKLVGRGLQSGKVVSVILTPEKIAFLLTSPDVDPFDGDLHRFRLGIEALRRAELQQECECLMGDIQHLGKAWVLPHPDRESPRIAPMVADPEIERIAVQFVIRHEASEGRVVESVQTENRGFDLISRKLHPEDPKTAIDVRFIEVKGRSDVGEIALTSNEYNTAKGLKKDYWLYVVFHCATQPSLNILRDPSTLDWQPVTKIEQYRLRQDSIARPIELKEDGAPYAGS